MTNHQDSMVIEQGDRRYHCIKISDCHINDAVYFEYIRKQCFNQETADTFYTYLLEYQAEPL